MYTIFYIKNLLQLFDRLKSERPGSLESKLQAISGDVTELELGMSASDRKLLTDNVSIVFHTAASVRFDDPLHEAIKINVRGTREVVNLTKEMKNIAVTLYLLKLKIYFSFMITDRYQQVDFFQIKRYTKICICS